MTQPRDRLGRFNSELDGLQLAALDRLFDERIRAAASSRERRPQAPWARVPRSTTSSRPVGWGGGSRLPLTPRNPTDPIRALWERRARGDVGMIVYMGRDR